MSAESRGDPVIQRGCSTGVRRRAETARTRRAASPARARNGARRRRARVVRGQSDEQDEADQQGQADRARRGAGTGWAWRDRGSCGHCASGGCADQARRRGRTERAGCLPAAGQQKGSLRCLPRCLRNPAATARGRGSRLCAAQLARWTLPYFWRKRSTRPAVSTIFACRCRTDGRPSTLRRGTGACPGSNGHEGVAARAGDVDVGVLGMDVRFHGDFLNLAGGGCDRPVS